MFGGRSEESRQSYFSGEHDKRADVLSVSTDNLSAPQEFLKFIAIDSIAMRYAISSTTDVFHLLASSENHTLCGLDVAPIIINRPAMSSTPYLTEIVDAARRLCVECADIETEPKDQGP